MILEGCGPDPAAFRARRLAFGLGRDAPSGHGGTGSTPPTECASCHCSIAPRRLGSPVLLPLGPRRRRGRPARGGEPLGELPQGRRPRGSLGRGDPAAGCRRTDVPAGPVPGPIGPGGMVPGMPIAAVRGRPRADGFGSRGRPRAGAHPHLEPVVQARSRVAVVLADGREIATERVARDPRSELVLLTVDPKAAELQPVEWAEADAFMRATGSFRSAGRVGLAYALGGDRQPGRSGRPGRDGRCPDRRAHHPGHGGRTARQSRGQGGRDRDGEQGT